MVSKQIASNLREAVLYSIHAGGKRIRPYLLLEVLDSLQVPITPAHAQVAAALEMIHTGSLIHDDLPAMDNDDLRRGKPTNHKVYGEAVAILAGDGLLNMAAETACKAFDHCENLEEYKRVGMAISALFSYSGADGMIGGQILDMLQKRARKKRTRTSSSHV